MLLQSHWTCDRGAEANLVKPGKRPHLVLASCLKLNLGKLYKLATPCQPTRLGGCKNRMKG